MVEKTTVFQMHGDRVASVEVVAGRMTGAKMLLSSGTFVIGRETDADLQLTDEPGVSRIHAKIVAERDRYRLVDNESRNGTLLNGAAVQSELLFDGDVIDIAQCRIVFRQLGGGAMRRPASAPSVSSPGAAGPSLGAPVVSVINAASLARPPTSTTPASSSKKAGRRVVLVAMTMTLLGLGAVGVFVWLRGSSSDDVAAAPTAAPTAAPPTGVANGSDAAAAVTGPATTPSTSPPAPPVDATAPPTPAQNPTVAATGGNVVDAGPATATTTGTAAADADAGGPPFVAVTSENHAEILRATERGRVQSTPVSVGAAVKSGDVLVVLAGEGGNPADLATRRESIAALEAIADGNEAATRQLATERAQLRALLSKVTPKKLVASTAGTLAALDVKVGDTVRQAQVFGRIETDAVLVRGRVAVDVAASLATGAPCELKLESGARARGTLKDKVDRGGGEVELVVSASDAEKVTGLRCPAP
jgi:biotin carboxyl carrier protein